jgi:hypothetical protein
MIPIINNTLIDSAEGRKEEEWLTGGIALCEGWESTDVMLTDFLAVLKLDKALLGNVLWQEFFHK